MNQPRLRLRRKAFGLASFGCALSLAIAAQASQAVVIGFDDQPSKTSLDEQYAPLGVHFGPSPFAGVSGTVTALARPAQAHSGPNVAALAYEAGTDFSSSWIHFDKPQRRVTLYACRTGGSGDPLQPNVNVDAYDSAGAMIDNQQGIPCTLNGPLVAVTVEKVGIAYINVAGFGGSAPPGPGWALDDLEFELDPPATPAPTPPALTPPAPAPPSEEPEPEGLCEGTAPTLVGTAAADNLIGTAGADRLAGKGGRDCLAGQDGRDVLLGGSDNDRLYGEGGSDRLDGDSGRDRISGGSGNDRLGGDAGNDRLVGGSGRDRLSGGSGADDISSGSGIDKIYARDNNRDGIRCGSGRDTVTADRRDRVARDCERISRR